MQTYETLKHSTWECKYHVVGIPKYRKKTLFGTVRRELGAVLRELARQKECEIIEGHLMVDHVHMLISIPPKYSAAQVMGFVKGKSAIHVARVLRGDGRVTWGSTFGREDTGYRRSAKTKPPCVDTSNANRASRVLAEVHSADGKQTVIVNQKKRPRL